MPRIRVKKNEWIGSIAARYGHKSLRPVLDHPRNSRFKKRYDPNLLNPGDVLFVPEPESDKKESGESEEKHVFKVERDEEKLVLRFVEIEA